MKAVYLKERAGEEGLQLGEFTSPVCGGGEVLVKVFATAITPTELQWFPTFNYASGSPRPFPIVLGHEFSGEIAAVGDNVTGVAPGDPVFGMNDWFSNGAQAEFCVTAATSVAPKPTSLDHVHAAAVPISALTAWQGLFDRAKLLGGERILIHGGAGGVGLFAVQFARSRGAEVIATASEANIDFVQSLGADQVIDHRSTRFEDHVRDADVVFDVVGGDTLERSWNVLRPGGRMVTIATSSGASSDPRVREAFFIVEPKRDQLTEIGRLIDSGVTQVFVEGTYALSSVHEAFSRASRGGMRGKVVLEIKD